MKDLFHPRFSFDIFDLFVSKAGYLKLACKQALSVKPVLVMRFDAINWTMLL